jgi:hypothetical protein
MLTKFLSKTEGKKPLEDLGVGGSTLLECILGKYGVKCGRDSSSSQQEPVVCCCEHDNGNSGSIRSRGFVD